MTNELVTLDHTQFPALVDGGAILERLKQNLEGEDITLADLTRIKVPTGGATTWSVPSADGDESCKAIDGIILHTNRRRAYWPNPMPTGDRPACISDGHCITGVGDPGGPCGTNDKPICPHNYFKTAVKQDGSFGAGKACKEKRFMFILRPSKHLPDVIGVPGASLKFAKQYLVDLSKIDLPFYGVFTRVTLKETKNSDNISYAEVQFEKLSILGKDELKMVMEYAKKLAPVFEQVTVEQNTDEA